MRKIFILSAVAASAVMTIVSCSKEQSEINPESIPGKATITGTLSYSLGQSYSSSAGFSEEIVPAAGVTVFVDVDNSGFKDGATGYTTYETVTDETGNYSVTVPATSQGVDVNIRANDFVAEASVVEGQKNGSPVFKTGDAIYHLEEYQYTGVKPGNVVEYSGMFDCQFFSEPVSFDYSGQVAFRVGFNSFDRNGNYSFSFADENVNVIVTAEYSGYDVPRKYGVTVRGGEAELEIPLLEEKEIVYEDKPEEQAIITPPPPATPEQKIEPQTEVKPEQPQPLVEEKAIRQEGLIFVAPTEFFNQTSSDYYSAIIKNWFADKKGFLITSDSKLADFILRPKILRAKVETVNEESNRLQMVTALELVYAASGKSYTEHQNRFVVYGNDEGEQDVAYRLMKQLLEKSCEELITGMEKYVEAKAPKTTSPQALPPIITPAKIQYPTVGD